MDEQAINKSCGMLPGKRQKLVRYYARLSEQERLSVHVAQTEHMRRHRKGWQHSQESLAYCMLIRALDERYRLEHVTTLRNVSKADLAKAEEIQVEKITAGRSTARRGQKRDQIMLHLPLIKQLLEKQLSWREIAQSLNKRFKISVAHSYLKKIYDQNSYLVATQKGRPPALPDNQPPSA